MARLSKEEKLQREAEERERKLEKLNQLQSLLQTRRQRRADHPLDFYVPLPHQARFHASKAKVRAFTASNRSGKTEANVVEVVRHALGKNPHKPDFPVPNFGWVISISNEAQRDILQPKFEKYIGKSEIQKIRCRHANVWDQVVLKCGSVIGFKSTEMGRSVLQGAALHYASFDEEPPKDVLDEVATRLVDHGGHWWMTFTPVNGMCFDDQTEILTENGWSKWNEVKLGDRLATFNRDKNGLEWAPCKQLYMKQVAGSMVKMTSRGFSALVTENHRWPVEGQRELVETKDLKHGHVMPKIAPWIDYPQERKYPDAWIQLLGWVLTDGTIPKGKTSVMIYQSATKHPHYVDKILDAATRAACRIRRKDYAYCRGGIGTLAYIALYGEVVDFIRKVGKDLPMWLLRDLTREQLLILYEALMDGDGSRHATGDRFTQKLHPKVVHGLQAICVMLGWTSTIGGLETPVLHLHIHNRRTRYLDRRHVQSLQIEPVPYAGLIWCASTDNETLIARRDGTVYISGNSWTYDAFVDPERKMRDAEVFTASMWDNAVSRGGHIPDKDVADYENSISDPVMRRIRVYGEYHSQVGRVYNIWNRNVHLVEAIPPYFKDGTGLKSSFDVYVGIDTGRCFAAAFILIDYFGNAWLFDEYYNEGGTIYERARAIHNILSTYGSPAATFIMDPSSQFFGELAEHGIVAQHADNDVEKGITTVQEYMAFNPQKGIGWKYSNPRLYVVGPNCKRFLYEVERYQWEPPSKIGPAAGAMKSKPLKKDDHVLDSLRYSIVNRPSPSKPPHGEEDDRPMEMQIRDRVKDQVRQGKVGGNSADNRGGDGFGLDSY